VTRSRLQMTVLEDPLGRTKASRPRCGSPRREITCLSRGAARGPHLWPDTAGSCGERLQPQRGALTQPRPTAWVDEVIPLGFAKALKGRDKSSEQPSYACSRNVYSALSGLNAKRRKDSRTQAVGLGCASAAPLGLSPNSGAARQIGLGRASAAPLGLSPNSGAARQIGPGCASAAPLGLSPNFAAALQN